MEESGSDAGFFYVLLREFLLSVFSDVIQDEITILLNNGTFIAKKDYLLRLNASEHKDKISQFVIRLIDSGETTFSSGELDKELTRLKSIMQGVSPIIKSAPSRKQPAKYDPEKLPESLKILHKQILDQYKLNAGYRATLRYLHYDKFGMPRKSLSANKKRESFEFARCIVSNDVSIAAKYSEIDYYLETGKLRNPPDETSEIIQLRIWLRDIVKLDNYVAKSACAHRKSGNYPNEAKFLEASQELQKINEYLRKHGN